MHFPHFMRRVNRVFTNPVTGTFAWLVIDGGAALKSQG